MYTKIVNKKPCGFEFVKWRIPRKKKKRIKKAIIKRCKKLGGFYKLNKKGFGITRIENNLTNK